MPEAAAWVPLDRPDTVGGGNSGRTVAIASTRPPKHCYFAQPGRALSYAQCGATWTPLMDSALTLAIGAVVISPSDPTTFGLGRANPGCVAAAALSA